MIPIPARRRQMGGGRPDTVLRLVYCTEMMMDGFGDFAAAYCLFQES